MNKQLIAAIIEKAPEYSEQVLRAGAMGDMFHLCTIAVIIVLIGAFCLYATKFSTWGKDEKEICICTGVLLMIGLALISMCLMFDLWRIHNTPLEYVISKTITKN